MQPLLQWKINKHYKIWEWTCSSFRYPAYNAYAPYCDMWISRLHCIFPRYLRNGRIFENRLLNTKCVFWVSLQPLNETFLILGRIEWDMIKIVHWSLCKVLVMLVRHTWNLNFFEKFSKNTYRANFVKILYLGTDLFHADGQTCRFWQFC
jgi:hypothetical protein